MNRYPKYKPSGIEWIGEIPEHWETNKLRIYMESEINGVWGEEEKGDENDKICIRVADFDREFDNLSKTSNTVRNVRKNDYKKRKLLFGDLLIEKSGGGEIKPVGRVGYYNFKDVEAVCANFMARIRLKINNDSRFFFYVNKTLYKNNLNTRSIKQTTGIQNLDTYSYFSEIIAIPPKPEQTAIANYLDEKTAKIDMLIEKKKNLIELLKEERTAVINKAVTRGINPNVKLKPSGIEWLGDIPEHWEVKKLKYIFQLSRGFDLSSNNFETGVIPVCGSNGIIGYHNKSTVKGPGITVGRSGSVGEVNFIETDFWAHNTCLYVYKNFDNNLKYIFYFLRVFDLKSLSSGSAVGTLNRNYIHAENIAFPTKFEQNQIVQHIEAETKRIDCAISKIEKEIELLIEYRIALISEVVTGKIKVA